MLAKRDPHTGHLQKRAFGPWVLPAFRVLAKFRFLRGTALDVFGRTDERKAERQLITDYERLVDDILRQLSPANLSVAVALASLPEHIRGYGHIKEKNIRLAQAEQAKLLERLHAPAEKLAAD